MPTDPFVAPELDATPRQEPNLAPGVTLPAATAWQPGRPGDVAGPRLGDSGPGGLHLGRPGPNVGYALTLVERRRGDLRLAEHEAAADASSVVAELAMKRAASFGRAPMLVDIDLASTLLGYAGPTPSPEFLRWRTHATHGAAHEYHPRRTVVDAVSDDALRDAKPSEAVVATVQEQLARRAVSP